MITLEQELTGYLDLNMVNYLLSGFKQGFRIGFEGLDLPLITKNSPSARDNPERVTAAIIKELERGQTLQAPLFTHPLRTSGALCLVQFPKKTGLTT